jgi:hypothetical protein
VGKEQLNKNESYGFQERYVLQKLIIKAIYRFIKNQLVAFGSGPTQQKIPR